MKLEDTLGGFQTPLFLCEGKAWVAPIAILLNGSSSEGNVCSLPQSSLKCISPALGRMLLLFYVWPFFFFFGNAFGQGAAFLPGPSSPSSVNF